MSISYEKFVEHYNKVKARGPDDPLYRFISATLRAAEIPGEQRRTDPSKSEAFLALHGNVERDMPDATLSVRLAETERRWATFGDEQKDAVASKPRPVSRVFADTPGPR